MRKRLLLSASALLILGAGSWVYLRSRPSGSCGGGAEEIEVSDIYVKPLLNKGQKTQAFMNWYACNELREGDLVLYRYNTSLPPVVRIARGVPGDHFELVPDSANHAWNIRINGKLVPDTDGKPYFFGAETPPTLSLYEKSRQGIVGPREAIVFSSFPPGDKDSGVSGLVSIDDLVAKIPTPSP
jgi:hypothetical protein